MEQNKKSAKKKLVFVFAVLLCMPLFLAGGGRIGRVFADDLAMESSYKIEIEGGQKFFYMRGAETGTEENENFLDLESGLYHTDSLLNIYLVEPYLHQGTSYPRYIYKGNLVISKDGLCFSNLPWTTAQGRLGEAGVAIEFYKNGSLIRQYELHDLTKSNINFEYSVSHVIWEDYSKRIYNAEDNTLSVTTLNGKTIIFDLTTGGIVDRSNDAAVWIVIVAVIGALAAAGIVMFLLLKRKKARSGNRCNI